jgi:hypothetical protein
MAIKSRQQIQSKKFMFTIIWKPIGFYFVDRLPNDAKMNSDYFVTNMLISLAQMIFPCRRAPHEKRLVISVDNCSVHTSRGSTDWLEKHGIHRIPDQLYSPNLATSDLYLFSTVKEKLERIHLADEDQFFECLQGVLRDLDQQKLNRVFQASVRRVQEVSEEKAMEATSDNKQVLSIKVLRNFIRPGWGMYLSTRGDKDLYGNRLH